MYFQPIKATYRIVCFHFLNSVTKTVTPRNSFVHIEISQNFRALLTTPKVARGLTNSSLEKEII